MTVVGTTMSVGLLAVTATLAVGLTVVGGASVTAQRVAGAADAAALAAADAASGAVATDGHPCETAARVAAASDAELTGCALDGLVATVAVRAHYAGIGAVSRARAGPPEGS